MGASAVDFMQSVFEQTNRQNDKVCDLREKFITLDLTTRHQIALGEAAVFRSKLETEVDKGKAELQRMRQLMVMVRLHILQEV